MTTDDRSSIPVSGVRPAPALTVALLLLASGLCALVYQIAWLRLLRLTFGASTAASAVVLAIFMGGLGLGGLLLGRRAEQSANPLNLYSWLETWIALSASLSPWLIAAVRAGYIALGGTAVLGEVAGTLLRLLGAALVLGVPTFLMGGTLPAAVRSVTLRQDSGRRAVGLLYGVNTLGAVVGATLTTFVLLEFLGTQKTLWVAALLNLLLAMLARILARRLEPGDATETPATVLTPAPALALAPASAPAPASATAGIQTEAAAPLWLILSAAAGVGFVFLAMELVWYRMLSPILGGSTYTFGVILAIALLGIGIGGWLYSLGGSTRRPNLAAFAFTCSLEAAFLALPLALGDRLALFALALQELSVTGFGGLAAGWTLVTAIVVLPAALVSGYQFPLLVALLGSGRQQVAQQVGQAYAWNTCGAILGSLLGGFLLVPALTAPGLWRLNVVLLLLLAGLSLVFLHRTGSWQSNTRNWVPPAFTSGLALLLLLSTGPTAVWRHGGIGAGRMELDYQGPNPLRDQMQSKRRSVIWESDGQESSIALVKSEGYAFTVNGKGDGSARGDAPTVVMSGLIGAALHADPKDILVIGLGTGATAGWLAQVPQAERVDVVELEPAVLRVAEACAPVNHDILRHPKVEMILGDGREYLLTTDQRYDVIFSQPSNPYRAGISSLFTREFYQAVRGRLKPGGVLVQWLQGYEVDAQVVRTAFATLASTFPSVETWQTGRLDLALVASETPLRPDPAVLGQRLAGEPYRSAMSHVWGVHGVPGFYSAYVGSPGLAQALAAQAGDALNTDDHPLIEFGFIRNLGHHGLFSIQNLHELSLRLDTATPPVEIDPALLSELRNARYAAFDTPIPPPLLPPHDPAQAHRFNARMAWSRGDLSAAGEAWLAQSIDPGLRIDLTLTAESLAELGHERTLEVAEHLRLLQPIEADAALARWHLRQGRSGESTRYLIRAFEAYRSNPWPSYRLMARALELATEIARLAPDEGRKLYDVLAEPFTIQMLDDPRLSTRLEVAFAVDFEGLCLDAFLAAEPYPSWGERYLTLRHRCYALNDHPLTEQAAIDLVSFYEDAPPRLWIPGGGGGPDAPEDDSAPSLPASRTSNAAPDNGD